MTLTVAVVSAVPAAVVALHVYVAESAGPTMSSVSRHRPSL